MTAKEGFFGSCDGPGCSLVLLVTARRVYEGQTLKLGCASANQFAVSKRHSTSGFLDVNG